MLKTTNEREQDGGSPQAVSPEAQRATHLKNTSAFAHDV